MIISVGSNIEPERNIREACDHLREIGELLDMAAVIETAPDGYQNQDDFLNSAYLLKTELDPVSLKTALQKIEKDQGRIKGPIKSGPRTLDLDIIIRDGVIVHSDYPGKEYVRLPVDELLKRHGIPIRS